ncbi:MAG: PaaI family thioesterase [bacterium]|nr:PaaI family thioesterase [bacterium]
MKLEDNHKCFVCGKKNPDGLKIDFKVSDNRIQAEFVPRSSLQGYANIVHGGIISTLLDEAMGKLAFELGINCLTAEINVRFKNPAYVGKKYVLTGELLKKTHRIVFAKAKVQSESDLLIAEATGKLMVV